MKDRDEEADWQSLIDLELASERTKRFRPEPAEFAARAELALADATYADGQRIARMVMYALAPPDDEFVPNRSRTARGVRVDRAMREIFGEEVKTGRPAHDFEEVFFQMAEQLCREEERSDFKPTRRRRARARRTISQIAAEAVENVSGQADEALAKKAAERFSRDKDALVARYREAATYNPERRIAAVIIDLFAACGLDTDPSVAFPKRPLASPGASGDELEEEHEERWEALARRD